MLIRCPGMPRAPDGGHDCQADRLGRKDPGRRPEATRVGRGALRQDDARAVQHRRQHIPDGAHRRRDTADGRRRRRRRGGGGPPRAPGAAEGRRHQPGWADRRQRHSHRLLQVHETRRRGERRGGLGPHPAGHRLGRAERPSALPRRDVRPGPEHQQPRQRGGSAGQQLVRRALDNVGQDGGQRHRPGRRPVQRRPRPLRPAGRSRAGVGRRRRGPGGRYLPQAH